MDLKSKIFAAKDMAAPEKYHVKAWDCDIYLKALNAGQQLAMSKFNQENGRDEFILYLICACLVDEAGNQVFTFETDKDELGKKSMSVLVDIFKRCIVLNGFDEDSVEDTEKN